MNHSFNKPQIENAINKSLLIAKEHGADAAAIAVEVGAGFSTTVRLGEIETIEHYYDKDMTITVYFGYQSGSVSTSDLEGSALRVAVEKAINIAKFTSEDPYNGLPDRESIAFTYPDLDLFHSWNITPEKASELAIQCENLARADKRISNSEGVSINTYDSLHFYGNSFNFRGSYLTSRHTISCAMIANDGHGMQRDYDYTTARDPQDLADISVVAKRVVERTVQRLGARKISTRSCPVIYAPEVARSLLGSFVAAISGKNLYRNASFLLNQLNKKIFPDYIQVQELPHLPKAIGSAPFDDEGVRTIEKDLVENGILKTYVLGTYSARKLGMKSTGNAGKIHNALLIPTGETFIELLKKMDTGLLITELMGQGVDLVTGNYSRGAFGYWVEKGEIKYPVQEITVAGNLKDMFANILGVGNDVDHRSNLLTGSILIEQMTIAGH